MATPRPHRLVFMAVLALLAAYARSENEDCKIRRKHIHLSLGLDPSTSVTISFASSSSSCNFGLCNFTGSVLIGKSPEHLNRIITESTPPQHYSAQYKDKSWYNSPYFHHIVVDSLEPSTKYYYKCISVLPIRSEYDETNRRLLRNQTLQFTETNILDAYSFVTAPRTGAFQLDKPITIAFMADIGTTDFARASLAHMDAQNKVNINVLMFAGDFAYSHLMHHRWDDFFDMLAEYDMTKQLPIMVAAGNHDVDRHPVTGAIFVAYEQRFHMPQIRPTIITSPTSVAERYWEFEIPYPLNYDYGNAYYAYTLGPSRNIVLCSYSSIDPGSRQLQWLMQELELINRNVTPWVTVTMHAPIYNSFSEQVDQQMVAFKMHLEPCLIKFRVNVVFSGHVHGYQRSYPTVNSKVNATGPVYIIGGNGGAKLVAPEEDIIPNYVAVRDWNCHGYATLSFVNQTVARWTRVCVTALRKEGNNTLQNESIYLLNQFFI